MVKASIDFPSETIRDFFGSCKKYAGQENSRSIYDSSIILGSLGEGDLKMTLREITGINDRGWRMGLEFIETNGDPVWDTDDGFRSLVSDMSPTGL